MTCQDVRDRLDDYLEGELAQPERALVARHLEGCSACLAEERALRSLLLEAASLPRQLAPARELWPGIAERLRGGALGFPRRERWTAPLPLAAAAAVLVAFSSAVTWRLARAPQDGLASPPAAAPSAAFVSLTPAVELLEAERDYARATGELLLALEARRGSLPPETLIAVEQNLRAIDLALKSLREALRSDPGSPQLAQLLATTHKRKLDTLRRVMRLSRI